MLNSLRNFSKGKLAWVLVAIIIIPFVFWGMGSVFSGGNTNSIGKINNHNLSTQDFVDFVNDSNISPEIIKENIDKNILEQLLTQLVSIIMLDLEIEKLNILISDKHLANKIKLQKPFLDDNNKFSRTKYEKYLLENNMTSINFESGIKKNELKKELLNYIGGGIKSPYFFTNKSYKDSTKILEIDFVTLNSLYKKKGDINTNDLNKYLEKNSEKFLVEKINFSLIKITPKNLVNENEFSDKFFSKIDQIENLLLNNINIKEIANKYNLTIDNFNEFVPNESTEDYIKEIYLKRNKQTKQLLDKNDFYILYEISEKNKILPKLEDKNFKNKIVNDILDNDKFNVHKNLLSKIQNKKLSDEEFKKISNGKHKKSQIKSLNNNQFSEDSIKLLYSIPKNSFSLITDSENNVFLSKIVDIKEKNISKSSEEINKYQDKTNLTLKNQLYQSYDYLLNEKYKIKLNQKTMDRLKNYFR